MQANIIHTLTQTKTRRSSTKNQILLIKEQYDQNVAGKQTMHEKAKHKWKQNMESTSKSPTFFIINTKFKHRPEHKITRMRPETSDQIDHQNI